MHHDIEKMPTSSIIGLGILAVYYAIVEKGQRVFRRSQRKRMETAGRQFYSRMWRNAAKAAGGRFETLENGAVEIACTGGRIVVRDNITSLDSDNTRTFAGDKNKIRDLCTRTAIPVPNYIVIGITEFAQALRMLQGSSRSLVVKPAEKTSGGAGVSTNIKSRRALRYAVAWALAYGPRVMVEEQVEGDCYRVLVMDGEVLGTVMRKPPTITGDGVSTIAQLIRQENAMRLQAGLARAQVLIGIDVDMRNTLASKGLSLHSRPADGEVVTLKRVINDNRGSENIPADGRLCSAILDAACKAAAIAGTRLAGVDIICRDSSVPLNVSGGAIIEVNATPGFYYHYDGGFDCVVPVANQVVARACKAASQQGPRPASGGAPLQRARLVIDTRWKRAAQVP